MIILTEMEIKHIASCPEGLQLAMDYHEWQMVEGEPMDFDCSGNQQRYDELKKAHDVLKEEYDGVTVAQPVTAEQPSTPPLPGDYVLATKYSDGDPRDAWAVGFYKELYRHNGCEQRHIVVDAAGKAFRANGYRYVQKISEERGAWIIAHTKDIEMSGLSMQHFAQCAM